MSKRGAPPVGLDQLTRVAERTLGDDPRATTFVRGMMLGALVGAAIAGSTLWQRRHIKSAAGQSPSVSDPTSGRSSP